MMPRGLHRLYAKLHGYFWLPCHICGRPFGGHEKRGGWLLKTNGQSSMTCSRCPGFWAVVNGRYCQLEPRIAEDGFDVTAIAGSSEWKQPPQRPPFQPTTERVTLDV